MKRAPVLRLLCCMALFAARCSMLPVQSAGGGGIEGEGKTFALMGTLVKQDGRAAASTVVRYVPATYNSVTGRPLPDTTIDTTDGFGRYRFAHVVPGAYTIQAAGLLDTIGVLISGIVLNNDSVAVPTFTLRKTGVMTIELPGFLSDSTAFVYLPGTTFQARVENGRGIIRDVPAGFIPAVSYVNTRDSTADRVIKNSITVTEGATTVIADYAAWSHSRRIYLNTTASGANSTSPVTNVPIPVRLHSANFSFVQANADGSDIRVAKADGTPLPFEIEQWDGKAQAANIWVRMDTIHGNDSTQFVTLYWGAQAATSTSNSRAVFDESTGAIGVWHLGEGANAVPGGYRDASASGIHLTGIGMSPGVNGVIGRACVFDSGKTNYLEGAPPSLLTGNVSFSVSFWVRSGPLRPANLMVNRVTIMDFGQKSFKNASVHFLLWPNGLAQFGFRDTASISAPTPNDTNLTVIQNWFDCSGFVGAWSFVTTVYKADSGSLVTYVNGQAVSRDTGSGVFLQEGGLRIGKPFIDNQAKFGGELDEVRIYGVPLSEERVRLEYEAQRPDSRLVSLQ